ncbi:glycosyltransferase [Paraconexibacter sp. AEG42_29]|uniref:Glycosyltransferase n=1 Tax=Paraconexibacter sp. AEG42_29 TaxID=2997339 RepID=A0AAU7B2J1_9ACTN
MTAPRRPSSAPSDSAKAAAAEEEVQREARARRRRERRASRAAGGPEGLRVCFDSRAAGDPRGIGRYVRSLLDALQRTAEPGDEIIEGHRPRGVDVYHSPWIDGAALRAAIPQVVTLHDLVPLKRRAEYLRTGVRFRLRYAAIARAQRVIVPTQAVADDAVKHLRVPEANLVVVSEAPIAAMYPRPDDEVAAVRARYGLPDGEYLVWVGGMEHPDPRKRVAALADTPRDLPLVLVGPARPWAKDLGKREGITITGHVTDDELAALYTGARALVFPSDDEGFGLPTVEALACGTPVVACDVPALREVLGERAVFVAQDDLPGLMAAGAAASRPAPPPPPFTWEDAARATWGVYRDVAGRR